MAFKSNKAISTLSAVGGLKLGSPKVKKVKTKTGNSKENAFTKGFRFS